MEPHGDTFGDAAMEEDLIRIMVIVGLAIWAGWGFMVGLRANQGSR
jgi:hypothetical protein